MHACMHAYPITPRVESERVQANRYLPTESLLDVQISGSATLHLSIVVAGGWVGIIIRRNRGELLLE